MRIQKLIIQALPSMNSWGAYQRVVRSQVLRRDVGWQIKTQHIRPVEEYPIDIEVEAFFVQRLHDTTNIFYQWKFIEDCLKKNDIIIDDSPRYVRDILMRQARRSETNQDAIVCYLCEGADVPRTTMAALYI